MKTISIVVPCYNEEKVIDTFYAKCSEITSSINNYVFEYIFVNDGSSDATLNLLKHLSLMDKSVRYISFSRNFGKEAAMLAGLTSSKGDYVVVMDVDLQHPPKLLTTMIKHIEDGYDSVAAKRVKRNGESKFRGYFSKKFYRIINKISDVNIEVGATDYRMMTRQMVDSVLSLKEYHRFTKGIFEWVGYDTKWIEYESFDREVGDSKWSFWSLFKYAIEGVVSFSTTPLKVSSFIGIMFAVLSFIYFAFTFCKTLITGIDMPGYASTICIVTFLGGVQLIALGIIGEYLSRVYMESKKRPLYFIKESNLESEKEE
ncbi:glycosyltransferase family 2 protein [Clostridium cylindrosporum]|uniref:Putative glycosyltransferase CsbB n=1 Tax=Clostridium cylindrosporum DSM 605 TaxID=1121307 RepID=A0A0J8DD85_CLOCY|nr:glycosyltransferase family 2 protein [Clostridium cylindrosporum]KMT22203.1 putative glycosyltransferase CsbB [Clostridium cylindrosporum DSM 605]